MGVWYCRLPGMEGQAPRGRVEEESKEPAVSRKESRAAVAAPTAPGFLPARGDSLQAERPPVLGGRNKGSTATRMLSLTQTPSASVAATTRVAVPDCPRA